MFSQILQKIHAPALNICMIYLTKRAEKLLLYETQEYFSCISGVSRISLLIQGRIFLKIIFEKLQRVYFSIKCVNNYCIKCMYLFYLFIFNEVYAYFCPGASAHVAGIVKHSSPPWKNLKTSPPKTKPKRMKEMPYKIFVCIL